MKYEIHSVSFHRTQNPVEYIAGLLREPQLNDDSTEVAKNQKVLLKFKLAELLIFTI